MFFWTGNERFPGIEPAATSSFTVKSYPGSFPHCVRNLVTLFLEGLSSGMVFIGHPTVFAPHGRRRRAVFQSCWTVVCTQTKGVHERAGVCEIHSRFGPEHDTLVVMDGGCPPDAESTDAMNRRSRVFAWPECGRPGVRDRGKVELFVVLAVGWLLVLVFFLAGDTRF